MLSQTDMQREIYEGREKARRDERAKMSGALEQGMTQGIEKGFLIGQILAYQEFQGPQRTPRSELVAMSLEDLERMADELRGKLGR